MNCQIGRLLSTSRLCRNYTKQFYSDLKYQARVDYSTGANPSGPRQSKSLITWKSFAVAAVGAAGLLGTLKYIQNEKDIALAKERQRTIGKAAIGGAWELVNTNGEPKKSSDYHGKWCLIYFGFTHCPDVCPDELEKMSGVVDDLEKENVNIQPLFITVDPQRDSKELLEKYIREFSSKLVGLTGTIEQIGAVCKKFRVYFSAGPKDKDDDYIVDHTIVLYLIDPKGEFVDYYGQNKNRSEITDSILLNVAKWNAANK